MKKTLLFAASIAITSTGFAGTIGENYEASGFSLGGYTSFYSPADSEFSRFTFSPNATFFPKQNLAISTGLFFQSEGFSGAKDKYTELSIGASYVFGYDEMAQTGLAQQVGASAYRGSYTDSAGNKYDPVLFITPYYRVDYYLTERVSLYSRLELFNLNLSSGAAETVNNYLEVSGGISVHFPNSFRDWSKIFNK